MIENFSFGKIVVNGTGYAGDIKIVDGKVVSNWWRKSGHHVDIEDVKDIIRSRPDVVVIGQGNPGLMKASSKLREILENQGIQLIEESTSTAIETYNRLEKAGKRVCAGIHVGC
jgi:hypothetical protein